MLKAGFGSSIRSAPRLDHLKAYPTYDAECDFELKLPLSMLMALMLRSEETQGSPQSLILDALADAGY